MKFCKHVQVRVTEMCATEENASVIATQTLDNIRAALKLPECIPTIPRTSDGKII